MTKVIETDAEGKLTPEQSEAFEMRSAEALKVIFAELAQLSTEELSDALTKMSQSEVTLAIVNKAFQAVLDADVPNAYNQALIYKALAIVQVVFEQVADKITRNEKAVIEKELGVKYEDLSPKDVVDYLTATE